MENPEEPDLYEKLALITDRAMRMELALRLIRYYAMGDVVLPESGAVRDWLRDWIDGVDNGVVQHGPLGGPMCWPGMQPVTALLDLWGFERTEGEIAYVRAGEARKGKVVQ